MFTQTFRAGQAPQVRLVECTGKLIVEPWDQRDIAVEAETRPESAELEGETLAVRHAHGDVLLRVPVDTTIAVASQHGDVTVRGIRALRIERAEGNLRVEEISDEVRLCDIYGATRSDNVESLLIEHDTRPSRHRLWRGMRRDIEISNTRHIEIAEASDDLTIVTAQHVAVGTVGGNAIVREVACDLRLGAIGGNCTVERIAGNLGIGPVGGNADLRATSAVPQIGDIGGNLTLDAAPLAVEAGTKHAGRFVVGGNARLEFPDDANLTIHATIGGVIRGAGVNSTFAGGMATIGYGAGTARLDLIVGGNLELYGGAPEISTTIRDVWARPGKAKARPGAERDRGPGRTKTGLPNDEARAAILHMVAAGSISTEEAERRLDALDWG